MNNELEKRAANALLVPGYVDRSMYPPPGQLPFERIIGMSERALDGRLNMHLKAKPVFHGQPYRHPRNESHAARALELKRIVLAMLEGYSVQGESMEDWYAPMRTWAEDVDRKSLHNILSDHLSRECKDRIEEVRSRVARDAMLFAPDAENRKMLAKINHELDKAGLPEFSMVDIINIDNVPKHKAESMKVRAWDIHDILKIFYLSLRGHSNDEMALAMHTDKNSLAVAKSNYMNGKAKDAIKTIRSGRKRSEYGIYPSSLSEGAVG